MNVRFIDRLRARFAKKSEAIPGEAFERAPVPEANPKVAFRSNTSTGEVVQVLFPSRIRQQRIEPEVMVYCTIYREHGRAVRTIELHGKMRALFGVKYDLWTVNIAGRKDDDLLREACEDGRELIKALRNPVECPEIPDLDSTVGQASATTEAIAPKSDASLAVVAKPQGPAQNAQVILRAEGVFLVAGSMAWEDPQTKARGKPSYCALIRQIDGQERKYWGSDLQRVLREQDVKAGDTVVLTKYPKTAVQVGNRTVQKNIWTCDVLQRSTKHAPEQRHADAA